MKQINSNKLALKMMGAMLAGIVTGLLFMAFREHTGADSALWQNINNLLFQDITAPGGERSLGLFFLGGQLFIRAFAADYRAYGIQLCGDGNQRDQ